MEFNKYKNKKVKISLKNNYYYVGFVQSVDDSFISIIDKNNKLVDISTDMITSIGEVGDD